MTKSVVYGPRHDCAGDTLTVRRGSVWSLRNGTAIASGTLNGSTVTVLSGTLPGRWSIDRLLREIELSALL